MAEQARDIASRRAELKRRRRELIAVAVAAVTLIAFVFAQTEVPPLTRHTSLGSNLAVITLFNLSFLLLGLLLFLVGRNVAKVVFERRRGLIGSKFQFRLVFGFIAVALVPTAFLLYVAGVFLNADVDSWFNPQYERVLDDSLEIAKTYYLNSANNAAHFARTMAGEISARGLFTPDRRADLKVFVEGIAELLDLSVERGAHLRIGGDPLPRECGAHRGETGRRRARVIDRHQRFVESLVDENAGIPDPHGGVTA